MTDNRRTSLKSLALGGCALAALAAANPALAADFTIAAQELQPALHQFAAQGDQQVLFSSDAVQGKQTPGFAGDADPERVLQALLTGTGLTYRRDGDTFLIAQAGEGGSIPQGAGAEDGAVEALIVTAQKREEAIQDVPIAISAFTQKALEEQKIEGGYDLLKAIPNVTFSKSNFSGYNFSIRGVGTKAISATTDPGVAVAFNNTTLIQNRLFEQEYYDVERVEVLRGPQGTLYGRNATSGVINVISAKPKLGEFEGSLKAEIGNYDSRRLVGMLNVPLGEMLAVRIAGAGTQRTGYDYNEITKNNVNGRDLWSGRVTVAFEPMPNLRATLLWEHFEEDDNRSRTSKQLCHPDPAPTMIGNTPIAGSIDGSSLTGDYLIGAGFSQACRPGNLYDGEAFGTPFGAALPFIYAPPATVQISQIGNFNNILLPGDPYGGLSQSRDLRTIASIKDPVYRAKADLLDLSIEFDIGDALTFVSQTVYNEDEVYSIQDYNRFNSAPAFTDTTTLPGFPYDYRQLAPGGVFCDPQIGCSDRVIGLDLSQAKGKQFSQEFRLSSDFDGPINFSAGANYTKFETLIDYYVFYNVLTMIALTGPFWTPPPSGEISFTANCPNIGGYQELGGTSVPAGDPSSGCPYIDPNPIESLGGDGHNYFRSKNPYDLKSAAVFGELYWNVRDDLKVTAGLRYTNDRKSFIPVPSQILLAGGTAAGGVVSRGYPEDPAIKQEWGEWTGRLGVDWKPVLPFTDDTMVYAFYSHGYKGGGANPPTPDFATREETYAFLLKYPVAQQAIIDRWADPAFRPVLKLTGVEYGPTFAPEFVDAIEVGAKNTLLGGAMTFNATGFFYDYEAYQVSQIRDRTAVNENFDATIWGLEFETVFSPSRDLRFNANLGYLDTKIADGSESIDIMNRTQGNPNYVVVKPWVQLPSNCVVPVHVVEYLLNSTGTGAGAVTHLCYVPNGFAEILSSNGQHLLDSNNGFARYDPLAVDADGNLLYPEINGGAGIRQELGGNELPNAPHWTMNAGAQYGRDILDGSWRVTMRGDAYWQSQSWARVYNAVNDKLHGWYNFNVSVRLENEDLGLAAEFYVKNLLDKSPITDAFINSDDSGLTTNVFVLDPRLVGFSLRKTF